MIKKNSNFDKTSKYQIKINLNDDGLILSFNNGNEYYLERNKKGVKTLLDEIKNNLKLKLGEEYENE